MQIVIVTGLSGAGKSTALRALEDVEFFCVDNLPLPMVGDLIDRMAQGESDKVAIAIDARQKRHLPGWREHLERLRRAGHRIEVMFLDARDDVLLRRFSETRRRHPLTGDDLPDGIRRDREIMAELRQGAAVVDTSSLTLHQLKGIIQERYGGTGKLAVTMVSFGFKHGLPIEFNIVLDVRFLPNPYFEPSLTHHDGRDPEVHRFVCDSGPGRDFCDRVESLLRFSLPQFQHEGKLYVTIAVGCTGGRHRSVAIVEELRRRLGGDWDLLVRHRDVERGE
ncbi:MAG TPA: RNase adapter RapZ [Kofleriaceae bacterium]|nr:RNase adapter RapZ [Kofleriaceae bacterium]